MWMMGVATAADPVGKNSESNNEEHEDEKVPEGDSRGRKKQHQRNFIGQDGDSDGGVTKNGGKRKKSLSRVVPRKHRTDDVCDTTVRKRKGKARASSIIENGEEIEGSLTGEKDEDLTMEDIMSIAKEVACGSRSNSKGDSSGRKKKKKRNFIEQDGDSGGCVIRNGDKEKTERPPRKPKSKTKASSTENGEKIENDEDLTMEDLMSIAKEYVNEDEFVATTQSSLKGQSEEITELQVSCHGSQYATMENEELVPSCVSKTKEIIVEPNMSGDPTQDMLDLFLGPLLKRTQEEEKKTNLISEEMSFAYELKKQKHSVVVREEHAPLTKKKSSLKEKVAMFLD